MGLSRQMTESESIRRVLGGDPEAFEMLVQTHYAGCLRFARQMLGRREPAEDAVQETFLRAYRGLGSYDHRDRFRAWLFRILINRCRTTLDQERRRRTDPRPLEELAPHQTPTARPDDVLARTALEAALLRLDTRQREAFLLRYVEQLSYEEMAEATGVGVSALKMRVARAKEGLRREIGHDND